jgi:trans-aconitate 2-methyltransferase
MNTATDWNPRLYLKYGGERTQAVVDLISHVKLEKPARIIDIGCGPGNSTQALAARWPGSRITGLDSSPAMIAKAKTDFPDSEWLLADAGNFKSEAKFDLVFSSAALQWLPDHAAVLARWLDLTAPGGALAVQMPLFDQMPMSLAIGRAAYRARWQKTLAGAGDLVTYESPEFYYNVLSARASSIDLWVTDYCHVLGSRAALIEWMEGTGLRPYLDRLPDGAERRAFEADLLEEVNDAYPLQPDGKVLFLFKRLFFIARH